tara:strand:+ start:9935 stop:10426 length:492 start_codon:yes stop_codon:yes gene_type:complete
MDKKQNVTLVDHALLIKSPISEVFDFLANHENYALWYPKVISIESANQLPHGTVGKIYKEAIGLPTGRIQSINITVVESRAPELFVTEGDFAPLHPRMEVRLSEKSARETLLNWSFYSRSQSMIGRLLIRMFLKKALARDSATGLARMKAMVENQASSQSVGQ